MQPKQNQPGKAGFPTIPFFPPECSKCSFTCINPTDYLPLLQPSKMKHIQYTKGGHSLAAAHRLGVAITPLCDLSPHHSRLLTPWQQTAPRNRDVKAQRGSIYPLSHARAIGAPCRSSVLHGRARRSHHTPPRSPRTRCLLAPRWNNHVGSRQKQY